MLYKGTSISRGTGEAVTSTFLILAIAQLLHVFNMAEKGVPLIFNEITQNRFVWLAILICFALLSAALHVPFLSVTLELTVPSPQSWPVILVGGVGPLVIGRLASWISSQSMRSGGHKARS